MKKQHLNFGRAQRSPNFLAEDEWVGAIQEFHTLAELRDALLPKLLSAELRVPVVSEKMAAAN